MVRAAFLPMQFVMFIFLVATQYKRKPLTIGERVRIQLEPGEEHDGECGEINGIVYGKWKVRLDNGTEKLFLPHTLDTFNAIPLNNEKSKCLHVAYTKTGSGSATEKQECDEKRTWKVGDSNVTLKMTDTDIIYGDGREGKKCSLKYCAQTPLIRDADVQYRRKDIELSGGERKDGTNPVKYTTTNTRYPELEAKDIETQAYEEVKLNLLRPEFFKGPDNENVFAKALRGVCTLPKSNQVYKKSGKKIETLMEAKEKQRRGLKDPEQPFILPRHIKWGKLPKNRCGVEVVTGSTYDPEYAHFYPQQRGVIHQVIRAHGDLLYDCGVVMLDDLTASEGADSGGGVAELADEFSRLVVDDSGADSSGEETTDGQEGEDSGEETNDGQEGADSGEETNDGQEGADSERKRMTAKREKTLIWMK